MEPGEFDVEAIKNIYGGGRYRYVVKERGKGTVREGVFEIDGVPQTQVTANSPAIGGHDVGLIERLSKIEEGFKKQEQTLTERMLTILLNRPSEDTNEEKILQRLALYKSLFTPEAGTGKAVVETVKELVPLLSAQEGGSLWPLLLDKLGPMLEKMTTMQHPQIPVPPQVGVNTPKPNEAMSMSRESELTAMGRQLLPIMISAASRDMDPATYATMIHDYMEGLPIHLRTSAQQMLSRPDWFDWLARIEPRVRLQEAWWRECHEQCQALLHESTTERKEETNNAQTDEPSPAPRTTT
jgi:hypothetical protein